MKFDELLEIVGDEPVFTTGLLLAGNVDPGDVRRQLSRWTQTGRLHQLRRGVYSLAPPYRKVAPHPFVIANHLVRGSYVSCQSALAHFGMIPEYVATVTSVCGERPARWQTPLGTFAYSHVQRRWLHGYRAITVATDQHAFVATPEKALLDLVYLHPGADSPAYLRELRLQNLEGLRLAELERLAAASGRPKLQRAATVIAALAAAEADEYETL